MENGNSLVLATPLTAGPGRGAVPANQDNSNIRRSHFPPGFVFGTGTASYQVEGGAAVGGRGPSVWDDFTLRTPDRIIDGSNGNVACDVYNRYKEDIRMMKNMGFDGYRFSFSWSRILPGGRVSAGINREGIDFYNSVIDTVIANGMKPYVTLLHFDSPHSLEQEYDGFLSKKIVGDFRAYAELCFWEFGDRVKWWTTLNEPWTYAVHGYVRGTFPPSKASSSPTRVLKTIQPYKSVQRMDRTVPTARDYSDVKYDKSDPAKDGYTVARNMLLAHAAAVHSYRTKFQESQQGQIGIVLCCNWAVPYDNDSEEDKVASKRAVDFMLGWFLEPVLYGRYPQVMIDFVPPENLAQFSQTELQYLKGSTDHVGFNYYTTNYVRHEPNPEGVGYDADQKLLFPKENKDGEPIGESCGSTWLQIVPWGMYENLVYMKEMYPDLPPVYITENGVSENTDHKLTASAACADPIRVKYHQDHLANILQAITVDKMDIRGYFAWSWCDNFEWTEGYTIRFGINYVDYMNNNTRHPKHSALWFAKFLVKDQNTFADKTQIEEKNSANKKRPRLEEE